MPHAVAQMLELNISFSTHISTMLSQLKGVCLHSPFAPSLMSLTSQICFDTGKNWQIFIFDHRVAFSCRNRYKTLRLHLSIVFLSRRTNVGKRVRSTRVFTGEWPVVARDDQACSKLSNVFSVAHFGFIQWQQDSISMVHHTWNRQWFLDDNWPHFYRDSR